MPVLGADMTTGTVVEYLVEPGGEVRKGQPLAVIDTEKAAIEVEAQDDGVLSEIVVPIGNEVPVGTLLALIAPAAEASAAPAEVVPPASKTPVSPVPARETPDPQIPVPAHVVEVSPPAGVRDVPSPAGQLPVEPPVASPVVRHLAHQNGVNLRAIVPTGPHGVITREDVEKVTATAASHVRSSPFARTLAASLGVDLARVTGTGPRGAITAHDVETAAKAPSRPAAAPAPASRAAPEANGHGRATGTPKATGSKGKATADAAQRRQAAVAALMARSKREIPHFYVATTVDCGPLLDWIAARNAGRPVKERLLPAAGLLRAVVRAATEVPQLNGFWVDDHADLRAGVDLGVAISLRDGSLVAPCLRDMQGTSVETLMTALHDVVLRARQGRLTASEASPPSITVTNLGELGVETVLPIIYPPQLAMVGLGRIVRRPWAVSSASGDALAVRPVVTVTLAVDHRAVNGHAAGLFLAAVERALADPDTL